MVITMKAIKALFSLLLQLTEAVSVDGLVMFKDTLQIGTIFTGTVKEVAQLESDALRAEYAAPATTTKPRALSAN